MKPVLTAWLVGTVIIAMASPWRKLAPISPQSFCNRRRSGVPGRFGGRLGRKDGSRRRSDGVTMPPGAPISPGIYSKRLLLLATGVKEGSGFPGHMLLYV